MKKIFSQIAIVFVAAIQFSGCGSGSSVTLPQQKTATVIFSASTTASLTTAVRVIKITAKIPAGATLPLVGSSKQVDSASMIALKPGSAVLGNYSAPLLTLIVTGDMVSSSGLGSDNVRAFAEVLLSYPSASPITESNFISINNPFPNFAATGLSGNSSVSLTGLLKPSMKVIF